MIRCRSMTLIIMIANEMSKVILVPTKNNPLAWPTSNVSTSFRTSSPDAESPSFIPYCYHYLFNTKHLFLYKLNQSKKSGQRPDFLSLFTY